MVNGVNSRGIHNARSYRFKRQPIEHDVRDVVQRELDFSLLFTIEKHGMRARGIILFN